MADDTQKLIDLYGKTMDAMMNYGYVCDLCGKPIERTGNHQVDTWQRANMAHVNCAKAYMQAKENYDKEMAQRKEQADQGK